MLPSISLFASAINTIRWPAMLRSLEDNMVNWEIVFAGPKEPHFEHPRLRYYKTRNIKPAQCHQIAAYYSRGELLGLTADDAIYPAGILDDIWELYNTTKDRVVISPETWERGFHAKYESFTFLDDKESPIMCPFGFFRRSYFDKVGGFDRKFVCGFFENDFFMRLYKAGIYPVPYRNKLITVEHIPGSNFSAGWGIGRDMCYKIWTKDGKIVQEPNIPFEPYNMTPNIFLETQGANTSWE